MLVVRDGVLALDNLGAGLPPLRIDIASVDPIVVNNLRLGANGEDAGSQEDQTIIVEGLVINSPYDPLTVIMSFEQIALTFNWEGIQRQQIKSLTVKNPTVYIGPDLFYFADQVQAAQKAAPATGDESANDDASAKSEPWELNYFRLWGGRLVVQSFGKPGFPLPMRFSAESENMVLENFANLPFNKIGFDIPPTDLVYETIGLTVINMSGELFVGLPPADDNAKNLVPVLQIEELNWRGVNARELSVSMTFDRTTVSARFGGYVEQMAGYIGNEGYVNGGVDIDLADFSWLGWASASKVALGKITRMLSPENFIMDGRASGKVHVYGKVSEVTGMGGTLMLDAGGNIKIVAVDEMLKNLPGDWWQPKREAVRALR
jgi:hypothetical protein